ncbi:MAG: hypothetical protein ABI396_01795 [Ktedonobacteraceae bacterium]
MLVPQDNRRKKGLPRTRMLFSLGSMVLVGLVVASTVFAFTHINTGSPPPSLSTKPFVNEPSIVKASQANVVTLLPKPTATPLSKTVVNSKTGLTSTSGFSFTAAGDYGQTSYTTANLNYIARSGVNFSLGLGDFDYDPNTTADAWSSYAKSLLPANFPFEIVAGGHDTQIDTLAVDLPDHIGNISGTYAKEYSFDYPPAKPLARFIIVSPSQILPGYNYGVGGADYNWVAQKIDEARAANIHWVIVGMHQYCFVIDSTVCPTQDFLDLLLNKKVDLILEAQKHTYQASKQLALNPTTCPTLPITSYNTQCVVNATRSFTKGVGSLIVVSGTGGTVPLLSIDSTDPKINYFRSWMGANVNQSFGVSQFSVTPTQISMNFVPVAGTFTDSFTLSG